MLLALRSLVETPATTCTVRSPPTQSGVANTRTSISKSFNVYAGTTTVEVDSIVDTEASFDIARLYINSGFSEQSGSFTGVLSTAAGFGGNTTATIKLEYEKDGGGDVGTDMVTFGPIRVYDDGVLMETYNFSGTPGSGPPSGWTEILNDGGTAVTGSHWQLVAAAASGDTGTIAATTTMPTFAGVGLQTHVGTIAATTTRPTFAASGNQTHLGTIAATTTQPTLAASGNQTHLGVLGATTTAPTFAGIGAVGSISGALAATTTQPTFVGAGGPLPFGAIAASTTAPSFAAAGLQTHLGVIAATTTMPTAAVVGVNLFPPHQDAHAVALGATFHTVRVRPELFRVELTAPRPCVAAVTDSNSHSEV